jgi:hypothetical protein
MQRISTFLALFALCAISSCSGGRNGGQAPNAQSSLIAPSIPQGSAADGIFNAGLPTDGDFNPTRVPAVSSLSQLGNAYHEASPNVTVNGQDADFAPAGASEYAIWRFAATPEDSVGNVLVELSDASPGANYWIAVADYSTGRWDWLGNAADGNEFEDQLNGSAGQHSSPAGYIYIAVLADTDNPFSVFMVTIEYLQRYDVSGTVLGMQDQPLGMALVTTNLLDSHQVLAGPDGGFTLNGIPNGSWAVMVTLDGYEFFPSVLMITVDNANITDLEFRGNPKISGFTENSAYEPNDFQANSYDMGTGPLVDATISILDDEFDYYQFNIASAGFHYIQYLGDPGILFPQLQLYNDSNVSTNYSSSYVLHGASWVGYYFQRPGTYFVRVRCEGGGGSYDLSLHSGEAVAMSLSMIDNGDPGDGDDGLYEELYNTTVQLEFDEFTSVMISSGTGSISNNYVAPLPGTVRPVDPRYTFTPESVLHDFSGGPLTGLDFNFQGDAPVDVMEPNDDKATATPLTLPLSAPVAGFIGGYDLSGNDDYDFFSFEVQEGKHVMFRARFPDNSLTEFNSGGYFTFLDAADNSVSVIDISDYSLQERTRDPLSAGTYYLELFMEGNLMPYELEIYEYDPLYLTAFYELDATPLEDCRMTVLSADQENFMYDLAGNDGLAEIDIPFMPGERVFVHHERFGMDLDPAYEWVQFTDSDIQLTPTASMDEDQHEPNDDFDFPALLSLPIDIEATLSSESDDYDNYRFTTADPSTSLAVDIKTDDQDVAVTARIKKASTNLTIYDHEGTGDHVFYYRADDADDYVLELSVSGSGEFRYALNVDKAGFDVYSISGTLDNGEPTEGYNRSYIVNHTTAESRELYNGSYLLGYYPDGDYEIQWQIANRIITPAGVQTVTVAGADAVQDFTSVYDDKDLHEPNDFSGDAVVVALPMSFSASLDYENDYLASTRDTSDYYKFVAPTDGVFEVKVTPQAGSPTNFSLTFSEDSWSTEVNFGKINPATRTRLVRYPVTSGLTYYIRVAGSLDVLYMLEADYIP